MIACKLYDADGHDKEIDCPEKLPALNPDQLFWAKATAPTAKEI